MVHYITLPSLMVKEVPKHLMQYTCYEIHHVHEDALYTTTLSKGLTKDIFSDSVDGLSNGIIRQASLMGCLEALYSTNHSLSLTAAHLPINPSYMS